jgi:tetratricopeptide (TPR) repeat protein
MQQLIVQKDYVRAVRTGEALLKENPAQLNTRFLTAYANQMAGNTERAIELYEGLIRDEPGLPEPRNNLAMIYLERGDYDRASQMLIDAINSHPSYATAYDNLSRIYKGIASEAYRRAVSESSEPAKYRHEIELTPIASLESLPPGDPVTEIPPAAIDKANRETLVIEAVRHWASAWSGKNFDAYTGSYADDFRADYATREQWIEQRRSRILRPGDIRIAVDDFKIRSQSENRAIIDFTQAFDSPTYSDRVVKRLVLNRLGGQWKITEERVLSVL